MATYKLTEVFRVTIGVMPGLTGLCRWLEHVKPAMVLETFRDRVTVADVARRH